MINWIESLLFREVGLFSFTLVQITIAAALIAKIVLVADHIPVIRLFREKPLIYGILWKTTLYWTSLFIVRLLIDYVPTLFQDGVEGLKTTSINWNLFIAIQSYYLMLLFIFVTFQDLTDKIGVKKMKELFLGL